jgi:hypothetical protein
LDNVVALKRAVVVVVVVVIVVVAVALAAESVEGATLALERVDDVHGGDGLSLGVLRVGDGVANDVLEEDLEDASRLLVDEARYALDASTSG